MADAGGQFADDVEAVEALDFPLGAVKFRLVAEDDEDLVVADERGADFEGAGRAAQLPGVVGGFGFAEQ